MTISTNGVAHIQLTVNTPEKCIPFWENLCHFLEMETLVKNADTVYCIGSRTGIMVKGVPEGKEKRAFDQYSVGLHHVCLRARSSEDVDAIYEFVVEELKAKIIHAPEQGGWAPGYYSFLFEDPDGIRIEFNFVPGKGHFGEAGRLGAEGSGPASDYSGEGFGD
ncbi:MAG: VOC family protein [Proteobacteria bacterium]|jgi:catechol 2,3-dioxygenase-like lactoylglutathione lyase family enzyme|nr:VOC family protein [Pseudomonadota bacterium]MBT5065992.1 VOC family protein [Pseudomonadota bacterium]MBT6193495.1 VOC family protein [Pseudomonadota bacterium]MBT6465908.1 VOC family protein [Pseudomonadota bacterium]MBT7562674.1 VOC family protein [Pseudomonadota bacterium]